MAKKPKKRHSEPGNASMYQNCEANHSFKHITVKVPFYCFLALKLLTFCQKDTAYTVNLMGISAL